MDNIFSSVLDVTSLLYDEMSDTLPDKGHQLVFEKLCRLGCEFVDAERARFWYWDKKNHILRTVSGKDITVIPETEGLVGQAIKEGRTITVNSVNELSDTEGSTMIMPLSDTKGEYIGAFQVIGKKNGRFDEREDRRKLSLCAVICGLSLESDIFIDKANTDDLTGLRNRKGFYADFDWRWKPVLNICRPCMVLMEILNFSDISYNYSAQLSVDILRDIADTITAYAGEDGCVYRWSGDSFLAVRPAVDDIPVEEAAEALAATISEKTFTYDDQTFSIKVRYGACDYNSTKSVGENVRCVEVELDDEK